MNKADILENEATVEEHSLSELQQWLDYGKHSWSLVAAGIFVPYGLILLGLKILAYIFTPYKLWHLYQAKWYKSVIVLIAFVVLPFIAYQFVTLENRVLNFMFLILPFLNFFIYTYVISYIIGEQMIKIKTLKRGKREEMSY